MERVDEGGILPGAEVQVVFRHVPRVTCAHKDEAGCDSRSLIFVHIPPGVRKIRPGAFQKCSSLVRVIILDSVTVIGNSAFRDCHSLISVVIPASVITIEHAAFNNCKSLRSLIIPDTVQNVGMGAFKGCTSLTLTISASLSSCLSGFNDCRINTKECRCRECQVEWFEDGWVCPDTWRRWQRGEYREYGSVIFRFRY
ncbi:BSPAL1 [Symbiodinium microadriaticum]|nr:BSPAL1 [Symbiodinium microadriaticum]CAE7635428.1 BSPAL1 [Symbiodinium sp. KB8]